jgi:iron complex outermembrane recepter protein
MQAQAPKHRCPGRQRTKLALAVAMAPALSLMGEAALAQPASDSRLEEVLVTATRRAETDIQTTPVAVTAITGTEVDRLIPTDLGDVLVYAPNVVNGKQPGFNSANFAIRGVGQNGIILYFENQVGIIVDDMVIPHIQTANVDMLDIQSVEILRGPQGTLFGKNTTGGVVNVKTNRPEIGANTLGVRGQVAEFGRLEGRAVANFALGETAAFRAAVMQSESDGYYENGASFGPVADFGVNFPLAGATGQGDGGDIGGADIFSGRFKFRWQPSDGLDINLAYEMVRDRGDTPPSVNETPDGGYVFNALGFTRDPGGDRVKVAGVSNREGVLLDMGARGHEIDVDGLYLNVDWEMNDAYTLSFFGGRRETDSWLSNTYTGEVGQIGRAHV